MIEAGPVPIVAVVHVDDILAVGRKERFDLFCEDSNHLVPINNLGELRWYDGCHYFRDNVADLLTISHMSFTENTVNQLGVTASRNTPPSTDVFLNSLKRMSPMVCGHFADW